MNQTVKFGKGRLARFFASRAHTFTLDPMRTKRPVVRVGVVDVKSSSERR